MLKVIDSHRVSVVGDVAAHKEKSRGAYEPSDFVYDYFPLLPHFLQTVSVSSNVTLENNLLAHDNSRWVSQRGYEE